jgi:TfoX/Sxy family transcriptional regulator of competence genes
MSTSQSTMDFLLDILSDSKQVSARKMFGEYCLYYAGRPVGLVCDEQLYLKPSEAAKRLMKTPDEGAPFPGARPHLRISPDDWDERGWMNALVRATFDSLPPPKPPGAAAGKVGPPKGFKGVKGDIASLPNLGPKSREMLAAAGILSVAQLRQLGAAATYARVKKANAKASLNLLWALEGALTDLPWQVVAREHRTSLLLALEQSQSGLQAASRRKPGK